jgi:hypothetical protein
LQAHFDLEMAKDEVGKQAAQINPHPHGVDGGQKPRDSGVGRVLLVSPFQFADR